LTAEMRSRGQAGGILHDDDGGGARLVFAPAKCFRRGAPGSVRHASHRTFSPVKSFRKKCQAKNKKGRVPFGTRPLRETFRAYAEIISPSGAWSTLLWIATDQIRGCRGHEAGKVRGAVSAPLFSRFDVPMQRHSRLSCSVRSLAVACDRW